jgi:hypothetical protein
MARRSADARRHAALDRIARLRERIARIDRLCSGTLLRRTKRCGKSGCRCAEDPAARHGPYAIGNYRTVRRLLRAWENETVKLIDAELAGK